MLIFVIIALFAVFQSFFGVGLLVFGTPTLLLLDYTFAETLAALLPASLAVSFLQVWRGGPGIERGFVLQFGIWCLLPLSAALAALLALHVQVNFSLLVAFVLVGFVALRWFSALGERTRGWVSAHQKLWLLVMGVVHGFSNLGGGFLTILAAARFRDEARIRNVVAFCYLCFAAIQLCVLALLTSDEFSWIQFAYAATSAMVYLIIGRYIFRWASAPVFDRLFTTFMALYAALLVLQDLGIL